MHDWRIGSGEADFSSASCGSLLCLQPIGFRGPLTWHISWGPSPMAEPPPVNWTRSNKTAMAAFADAAGFGRRAWERHLVAVGSGSGKTMTLLHELTHVALEPVQTPSLSSDAPASAGGSGLPAPSVTHLPQTPRGSPSTFFKVAALTRTPCGVVALFSPLERVNPAEVVRQFMLRLIILWRRADPARFARLLALQLRLGRLWAVFRPPRPPGQLMMASSHVTRGPDLARMTRTPWSSAVSCLALT